MTTEEKYRQALSILLAGARGMKNDIVDGKYRKLPRWLRYHTFEKHMEYEAEAFIGIIEKVIDDIYLSEGWNKEEGAQ